MRARSIRQPYAELILRGIKTAELRSISTTIVGERFYIYGAKPRRPPVPIFVVG
jgi:predicted transcriptional regulator